MIKNFYDQFKARCTHNVLNNTGKSLLGVGAPVVAISASLFPSLVFIPAIVAGAGILMLIAKNSVDKDLSYYETKIAEFNAKKPSTTSPEWISFRDELFKVREHFSIKKLSNPTGSNESLNAGLILHVVDKQLTGPMKIKHLCDPKKYVKERYRCVDLFLNTFKKN